MHTPHHSLAESALSGLLDHPKRTRNTLLLLTLGVLLGKSWRSCAAVHRRRQAEQAAREPQMLRRWEGEGGRNEPPVGGSITE